jgi:hypothetical protein
MKGIFDGALNVGGYNFKREESSYGLPTIRIIPTIPEASIAFCTLELLKYNQEWTPLGQQRWLKEREKDGNT